MKKAAGKFFTSNSSDCDVRQNSSHTQQTSVDSWTAALNSRLKLSRSSWDLGSGMPLVSIIANSSREYVSEVFVFLLGVKKKSFKFVFIYNFMLYFFTVASV